jgi:hypothetical protein
MCSGKFQGRRSQYFASSSLIGDGSKLFGSMHGFCRNFISEDQIVLSSLSPFRCPTFLLKSHKNEVFTVFLCRTEELVTHRSQVFPLWEVSARMGYRRVFPLSGGFVIILFINLRKPLRTLEKPNPRIIAVETVVTLLCYREKWRRY